MRLLILSAMFFFGTLMAAGVLALAGAEASTLAGASAGTLRAVPAVLLARAGAGPAATDRRAR